MAGLFDFERYYTKKTIKTDIKLDVGGLEMPSGSPTEYITNNVMYKIVGIVPNTGSALGTNDRVSITQDIHTDDDQPPETSTTFYAVGYPLDEMIEAGLYEIPDIEFPNMNDLVTNFTLAVGDENEDSGDTISSIEVYYGDNPSGKSVNSLTVVVQPRIRLENKDKEYISTDDNVDQNFWHMKDLEYLTRSLAACGLKGDLYKGMKWYNKQADGKVGAVYTQDSFTKMVNSLSKVGKENGLGVKVTFFDRTYMDPVDGIEDMKGKKRLKALLKADWTATDISRNAKVVDVYPDKMDAFIEKCKRRETNPIDDISGDTATALIPNVSDVFKKLYYPKDELADDFTDKYFATYNSIMSIKGVRTFMSSSLKRKLRNDQFKLKKTGERSTFAVDIASCANFLKAMYRYDVDWISYGLVDNPSHPNDVMTYGVRGFSDVGFESIYVNGHTEYDQNGNSGSGYAHVRYLDENGGSDFNTKAARKQLGGLCHYYFYNQRGYTDWQMSTSQMSVAEIKSQLADYYAGIYNDEHDLDDDDEGYMECSYEDGRFFARVNVKDEEDNISAVRVSVETTGTGQGFIPDVDKLVKMVKDDGVIKYAGSVAQYAQVCMMMISMVVERGRLVLEEGKTVDTSYDGTMISANGYINYNDSKMVTVVDWDVSSTAGKIINEWEFEPAYETLDNLGQATDYTINDCAYFATDVMADAIDEIDTIITTQGFLLGPVYLLIQKLNLANAKEDYAELQSVMRKIIWYQMYTNESVFENKTMIGSRDGLDSFKYDGSTYLCPYIYFPARFMVPVKMYQKVRIKYKRFFRTRHKTVKRSIGVRWAEVTFVDTDVYQSYPQNVTESMQFYPIGKTASVSGNTLVFDEPLEGGDDAGSLDAGSITQFGVGQFAVTGIDGLVPVTFTSSDKFVVSDDVDLGTAKTVNVTGIYVPLPTTTKSDDRTRVRVEYKMPYIPYDSEIRRWAFMNYGAFDQSPYASETREVPADPDSKLPGWQIFHRSSKRIGDLRAGMGIYDAVSILLGILRNEYGAPCVELAETMRSKEDQALVSSGGGESTFLSWHNYGLAVKILINDPSTGFPIEDGSDDMKKLIKIADAFTKACFNGAFGKPLNVVWCGRLKMGANIFVWEFLPIGVNHKDAPKFRDALLNQEDPVASLGYVDVDNGGFAYDVKPETKVPYVLRSSSAYKNAIVINGAHYVSPRNIRNYVAPHDIVLKNVLEFCNLIRTKMEANGSQLNDRASMYEWKTLNDRSYKQLLMYYGMTGSISAARALVCGEYVETYRNIVDRKFTENAVDMVKEYLGDMYADAKIFVEESADGGAWISLADGKMHLKSTNVRSVYTENSKDNYFGDKMAPVTDMERGLYRDGVFITEDELIAMGETIERVSEDSYIEGFDKDGNVVGDDALFLHGLVATQIKEEFDKLRETFENYGGGIMYDHFADGPNAGMADMVENEFGLIAGQDLIDFDSMEAIFAKKDVDEGVSQQYDTDGEVYEKVVSNAELAGVRKASLTKEHINVTVASGGLTTEKLYKLITKGVMTQATDMFTN